MSLHTGEFVILPSLVYFHRVKIEDKKYHGMTKIFC